MKGKTKYLKIVSKSTNKTKQLLMEKAAIPIFTMFVAPVLIDDPKSEDMVYGYTISGEAVIGMGEVIGQLRSMVDQIEKDLLTQLPDEKKA